jgi:hypothetical protein
MIWTTTDRWKQNKSYCSLYRQRGVIKRRPEEAKGREEGGEGGAGPTRVEAGSNTSTVTLRVVGGDEKGSLKSETVKYGQESYGTRTQETLRWREPAAYKKDRPVLSLERAPQKNKTVTARE